MIRVGHGWDIHRLVPGRPLCLGGVTVSFDQGLLGHSDGDVILHAICDALLGAAAAGDLGGHFPDTDPQYRGADSGELLARTAALVSGAGFTIGNVDVTVLAEAPKMAPHLSAMRARIAALLGIDTGQVSVKAKTAEGLGAVGRGEAIVAFAVALVERV